MPLKNSQFRYDDSNVLYPAALAKAFPDGPLTLDHLVQVAEVLEPSPTVEKH